MSGGSDERPAVFFDSADDFRQWLLDNHDSETELWMGLRAKHVAPRGLTWKDAVPVALCFGWIDSVSQRIDDDARRQRWTPRRPGSVWSLVNVAHVERLSAAGLMHPAGLAVFEQRRPDSSALYALRQSDLTLTDEELARLEAVPAALAFWENAIPSYRKTCIAWIRSAKRDETRLRRLHALVDDCAAGELVAPQRPGKAPAWLARARAAARSASGGG